MPPTENEKSQALIQATDEIKKGAELTGFHRSGVAKTLEYVERASKAVKDKAAGKKGEDPDSAKRSLAQFAKIDYDTLSQRAREYSHPASFEWISPEARPKIATLSEYALVTRAVPETSRISLDPNRLGGIRTSNVGGELRIVFDSEPSLAFAPDKILAGCLTSKDKTTFYYPHYDQIGKLVSTTAFEASRTQFYLIEKAAREALVKRGDLRQPYPDKTVDTKRWGQTRIVQRADNSVQVTVGNQTFNYQNGLIDFPVDEYNTLDVLLDGSDKPEYTAQYSQASKAMTVSKQILDMLIRPEMFPNRGVDVKDIALITARHELNHAIWGELPDSNRAQLMNLFDLNNPRFAAFTRLLMSHPGYRQAATADVVANPQQDTLTVNVGGQQVTVGKERVVNELLAYATWPEIVGPDVMIILQGKNPILPLSNDVISDLKPEDQKLIQSKLLRGIPGSGMNHLYFQSFLTASKVLDALK